MPLHCDFKLSHPIILRDSYWEFYGTLEVGVRVKLTTTYICMSGSTYSSFSGTDTLYNMEMS